MNENPEEPFGALQPEPPEPDYLPGERDEAENLNFGTNNYPKAFNVLAWAREIEGKEAAP